VEGGKDGRDVEDIGQPEVGEPVGEQPTQGMGGKPKVERKWWIDQEVVRRFDIAAIRQLPVEGRRVNDRGEFLGDLITEALDAREAVNRAIGDTTEPSTGTAVDSYEYGDE
jgi:hypothetical protein